MKSILLSAALLVFCITGVSSVSPALAQDAETESAPDIEILVEAHTSNSRVQTERPDFEPEEEEPRDRGDNPLIEAIGKFFAWLIGNFGGVFRILIIAAIVAVIGYALWYMLGGLTLPGRKKPGEKQTGEISENKAAAPDRDRAEALLEEADALAAEGRYAEAVHLLLFRSIADLNDRRKGGVPQSLTAREIEALGDLPDRARQALSPIIRLVERSFFGGRPVDESGWQVARTSYEHFAFRGAAA